jgi:hypothetical protein
MELIHTIKLGEGDSSLALGMTCDVVSCPKIGLHKKV